MKTKYDARHQLRQLNWSDEELDAIGLTLQDEGTNDQMPSRPWLVEHYDRGAEALKMFGTVNPNS